MFIKSVELQNFRNIEKISFEPSPGVNVIYGENAQGKTNILEGIWMFSGFRSFRTVKDGELVRFGQDFSSLRAEYSDEKRDNEAVIKITKRRNITLNGVGLKSASEMIGKFNTVIFAPEFMSIVKSSADERRSFLDTAICRLSPSSAAVMSEYSRILKQRNTLIKNPEELDEKVLDCLDEQLSVTGDRLVKLRLRYIEIIKPYIEEIFVGISSGREKIGLNYVARHNEDFSRSIYDILKENRQRDIITGMTSAGPHRDDMEISINGTAARAFGSQGQQRSCAIALKLSEAAVIAEKTGIKPVVLLDDVMSELDVNRQDYILNHIGDRQVFITCCEPGTVMRQSGGRQFEVVNGKISCT